MKYFILVFGLIIQFAVSFSQNSIQQNRVLEWSLFSEKTYENPFYDLDLAAIIQSPDGRIIRLPAFWKGNGEWAFRFSSPQCGSYTFITECSDKKNKDLHGQKGTFRIVPYKGNNPLFKEGPVNSVPGRKFLTHQSGKPFLWLADSWWFGMSKRISYSDFCFLVNDRQEKGFSVIQFAIGFACDIEPFDDRDMNEAGFMWREDMSSINPDYFEYTDRRIEYLVESGIMPNLVGSWGYYIHFLGTERMKKHWQYLIARYGAYPLSWTLCGEAGLTWYKADKPAEQLDIQRHEWSVVAEYIKATDPFHRLLTVHTGPNSGGHRPIEKMELIDIFLTQPGHNDFETLPVALTHLEKAREMYPDKPFMAGEVCFEGMGGSNREKIQRYLFWSHLLSDAAGHSYGTDAMWQFNSRSDKFGPSVGGHIWGNEPWEEAYQWGGSKHVGVGKRILEKYEWYSMKSHPEWITPSATPESFMSPFAAGIERKLRIFYFPGKVPPWGNRPVINKLEENVLYSATWIDPLTGEEYPIGKIEPDKNMQWKIPFAPILQDWVLILEVKN